MLQVSRNLDIIRSVKEGCTVTPANGVNIVHSLNLVF